MSRHPAPKFNAEDIIATTPITPGQLAEMRRGTADRLREAGQPIDFDGPAIDAVLQALEDWWGPHYPEISDLIDSTLAQRLSVPQKYLFIAEWMRAKADEYGEGV